MSQHKVDFNQLDANGELIIEMKDNIFCINESNLRTPIEDDFEYEILVDSESEIR